MADDRNRAILRLTLGIVGWLYCGAWILTGFLILHPKSGVGAYSPRAYGVGMLAHAVVFALAGQSMIKGARLQWPLTILAALGSIAFTALDARVGAWYPAAIDAFYPLLVLLVLWKGRA